MSIEKIVANAFHKTLDWSLDGCMFNDSLREFIWEVMPADEYDKNEESIDKFIIELKKKVLTFSENLV